MPDRKMFPDSVVPLPAGLGPAVHGFISEARHKHSKPPLPFLGPLLYPLLCTSSFRDNVLRSDGAYIAGPGYGMVTGLGVPTSSSCRPNSANQ